jgi:hypothetical protein
LTSGNRTPQSTLFAAAAALVCEIKHLALVFEVMVVGRTPKPVFSLIKVARPRLG